MLGLCCGCITSPIHILKKTKNNAMKFLINNLYASKTGFLLFFLND
jgi:hypothetical protein